jgi:hypothetical protein
MGATSYVIAPARRVQFIFWNLHALTFLSFPAGTYSPLRGRAHYDSPGLINVTALRPRLRLDSECREAPLYQLWIACTSFSNFGFLLRFSDSPFAFSGFLYLHFPWTLRELGLRSGRLRWTLIE